MQLNYLVVGGAGMEVAEFVVLDVKSSLFQAFYADRLFN